MGLLTVKFKPEISGKYYMLQCTINCLVFRFFPLVNPMSYQSCHPYTMIAIIASIEFK